MCICAAPLLDQVINNTQDIAWTNLDWSQLNPKEKTSVSIKWKQYVLRRCAWKCLLNVHHLVEDSIYTNYSWNAMLPISWSTERMADQAGGKAIPCCNFPFHYLFRLGHNKATFWTWRINPGSGYRPPRGRMGSIYALLDCDSMMYRLPFSLLFAVVVVRNGWNIKLYIHITIWRFQC